jgi:hypothetical protein
MLEAYSAAKYPVDTDSLFSTIYFIITRLFNFIMMKEK